MLPAKNRLRTSKDFALTTKTGVRATSLTLVVYLRNISNNTSLNQCAQIGLIVNKSIGGSVARHRVSRQLRHLISKSLPELPENSHLVIRVLRKQKNFEGELKDLVGKVVAKSTVNS